MVAVDVLEGRNVWLTDANCFGTCNFWHERKPGAELVTNLGKEHGAELVTELGKEPGTRPQTELYVKPVVQLESPLGTAKENTLETEL